jgi:hypothetical protein
VSQLIRYVFPQGISSNKPALFPGIRSTIIKLLGLKVTTSFPSLQEDAL